ncbi:MAG: hypothetical protein QNJ22_08600 [Desulfosarcinaceae bacterium]|nr:hypothetical protein [Desulfosarcinaceae bacterium]
MPVYSRAANDLEKLAQFESVLITPCRFCPAASLAVRSRAPYIAFFRHLLQTAVYERAIETMQSELRSKGVRADVFRSRWLHQFVLCMWTRRRRMRLMKRAQAYDAVVVLGCEAAAETVLNAVGAANVRVVLGMRSEGIMSIVPRFQWPGSITLQLNTISPLIHGEAGSREWSYL